MSDGRTVWWPKDSGWWRREYVVELGEEFGPAGPAVLDWLSCEAKAQNDGGRVKAGIKSAARGCFVDVLTVGHVLSRSVTLGALDDFEERGGRFVCRISGWSSDDARGRAAVRKARQRERESGSVEPDSPHMDAVTERDTSRPVTVSHAEFHTGQDSNKEKSAPHSSKRGAKRVDQSVLPATFPAGLSSVARECLAVLLRVYENRGGLEPSMRGVGMAITANPERDFVHIAGQLEHWALAGAGLGRDRRDWVGCFRTFLERAPRGKAAVAGRAGLQVVATDKRSERRREQTAAMQRVGAVAQEGAA